MISLMEIKGPLFISVCGVLCILAGLRDLLIFQRLRTTSHLLKSFSFVAFGILLLIEYLFCFDKFFGQLLVMTGTMGGIGILLECTIDSGTITKSLRESNWKERLSGKVKKVPSQPPVIKRKIGIIIVFFGLVLIIVVSWGDFNLYTVWWIFWLIFYMMLVLIYGR